MRSIKLTSCQNMSLHMQVTYITSTTPMQHACTCNPLIMHHNIIITAVHDAHARSRQSRVSYAPVGSVCWWGCTASRRQNFYFPAEYRGGSLGCVASSSALRLARLCARSGMRKRPPRSTNQRQRAAGGMRKHPISVLHIRTRCGERRSRLCQINIIHLVV